MKNQSFIREKLLPVNLNSHPWKLVCSFTGGSPEEIEEGLRENLMIFNAIRSSKGILLWNVYFTLILDLRWNVYCRWFLLQAGKKLKIISLPKLSKSCKGIET
jgi:hypothetical protein